MARKQHNYTSGRIHRASDGQPQGGRQRYQAADEGPVRARKKKRSKKPLIIVLSILAVGVALIAGLLGYLDGVFEPGAFGQLINKDYVPKDYSKKDVVHFLIVGIDYEEGRQYENGLGMTDMILYASYDVANNQLNLLQIPRDSYVGEEVATGGSGKINAALIQGSDKNNPINNLVDVIEQQFKLPVDHYIAMDMDALKTLVDTFGGLNVYVPREMSFDGSYLPQGWHVLDGASVEFFVRNRHGEGFERADIDRLDNQRYFYSALFRRFLEIDPVDIVKLLPVFKEYCNTDLGLTDLYDLAFSALKLSAENVVFCKAPGATGPGLDPTGSGRDLYIIDKYGLGTEDAPGVATVMNDYFRAYSSMVQAQDLGLPEVTIPDGVTRYPPNIQVMSSVQQQEGAAG